MASDDFALSPPTSQTSTVAFSGKESRAGRTRRLANTRLAKMRQTYGRKDDAKCGECANLIAFRQSRTWFKCKVYGVSSSEASDWRKKWPACGKFEPKQ